MRYRYLGRTGVQVSEYMLGTMSFGSDGNTDERECIRIVHGALDCGINFIDTADTYSHGEAEDIWAKRSPVGSHVYWPIIRCRSCG